MSRSSSGRPRKAPLVGIVLALGLCGLLLLTTACQDLGSDTSTTLSTTTTTTGPGDDSATSTDADSPSGGGGGGSDDLAGTDDTGPGDDPGSDDGDGTGTDDLLPDGPIATAFLFTTTTEDRSIGYRWSFDEDDNSQRRTIRVRDYITVELEYPRYRQVTSVRWNLGGASSPTMIGNHRFERTRSLLGDYIIGLSCDFIASEPGDCSLQLISYHQRDGEYHIWQVYLTVTE